RGPPEAAAGGVRWRRLRRLGAPLGALGLCLALLLAAAVGPRWLAARSGGASEAARPPGSPKGPLERRVRGVPVYLHGRGGGAGPGGLLGLSESGRSRNPFVKDVVNGEPLYVDEGTYASEGVEEEEEEEEQNWIVRLPQDWDDDQLAGFIDKYGEHERVVWIGTPSNLALSIVVVHSTLSWIEGVLSKAPPGFVLYVEQDSGCSSIPIVDDPDNKPDHDPGVRKEEFGPDGSQSNPPSWGTDRIDAELGLNQEYAPDIVSVPSVHVYVLDTGIRTTHNDFAGRAIPTLETVGNTLKVCDPADTECATDRDGHGTFTAGTIAGQLYGVAKAVTLHAVKVLDDEGNGQFSYLVSAVNWIIKNGQRPAVMSASLSGKGTINFVTDAIDAAVQAGVTFVVAAGNNGQSSEPDACNYSPARVGAAITVGATDTQDREASYSNSGPCVDIMAPGSAIVSAGITGDSAEATKTGTSMAAPHVAGAVALMLSVQPELTPQELVDRLKSHASKHVVKVRSPADGSPDSLLFVKGELLSATSPTTAPSVSAPCGLGWRDVAGPCRVDEECCLLSPNYPQAYGDGQLCIAAVGGAPGAIRVDAFSTEAWFDRLHVNGVPFWGDHGPSGVVPAGLRWSSDFSVARPGWRLCLPERQPAAGSERAEAAQFREVEPPAVQADEEAGCAARCVLQGANGTCAEHALRQAADGAGCSSALAAVLRQCRSCYGCALDDVGCTAPGEESVPEDVWQPGGQTALAAQAAPGQPSVATGAEAAGSPAGGAADVAATPGGGVYGAAGPQVIGAEGAALDATGNVQQGAIGAPAGAVGDLQLAATPHLENAATAVSDAAGAALDMAGQLHQAASPHLNNAAGAASDVAGAAVGMAGDLHQAVAPHLGNAAGAASDAAGAALDMAGDLHQAAAAGNLNQAASAHVDNAMGAAADMAGDLHQAAAPHLDSAADAAVDAAGALQEAAAPHVKNAVEAATPHVQHAISTVGGLAQDAAGKALNAAGEAAKKAAADAAQSAAEAAAQKAQDTLVDAHQAVMDGSLHEAAKPHLDNAMDAAGNIVGDLHQAATPHLSNAADATLDAASDIQDAAGEHLSNAMDAAGDVHDAAKEHFDNVKNLAGGLFR
ncbi:unnamed protein product, partial [Prorocentrum cordatum]